VRSATERARSTWSSTWARQERRSPARQPRHREGCRRCREAGAITKVIIETAYLTDEEKVVSSHLAKVAKADFVKTSTGFGPGGATAHDVLLMRETVGPKLESRRREHQERRRRARDDRSRGDPDRASASVQIVTGGEPGDGRY